MERRLLRLLLWQAGSLPLVPRGKLRERVAGGASPIGPADGGGACTFGALTLGSFLLIYACPKLPLFRRQLEM